MDSFPDSCPHKSIPVETDESMTSSSLDLVWPSPCQQCSGNREHREGQGPPTETGRGQAWFAPEVTVNDVGQVEYPKGPWRTPMKEPFGQHRPQPKAPSQPIIPYHHLQSPIRDPHPADVMSHTNRERGLYEGHPGVLQRGAEDFPVPPSWLRNGSTEGADHLELPLPLMSDFNIHCVPPGYPPCQYPEPVNNRCPRQYTCQQPLYHVRQVYNYHQSPEAHQEHQQYPPSRTTTAQNRLYGQDVPKAPSLNMPQRVAPAREVMNEVSVVPSHPATPCRPGGGGTATQEMRRTISLPEECRNIFITYSVDTAKEILTFMKFLTDQGFNPAIDIFDNPLRRMDINRWMDGFLKDKSVLIIVVLSPKYKADVEGDGEDEHGLHTKYIHTQIQNEFIQQRCLNFRLVPVLFPSATKNHVPNWLQSTRIYRWPQDTQDLLLRLLREERYIAPPLGKELTLTVRPL